MLEGRHGREIHKGIQHKGQAGEHGGQDQLAGGQASGVPQCGLALLDIRLLFHGFTFLLLIRFRSVCGHLKKKAESPSTRGLCSNFHSSTSCGYLPQVREKISVFLRIPTLALPKSGEVEGIHPPLSPLPRTPLQCTVYAREVLLSSLYQTFSGMRPFCSPESLGFLGFRRATSSRMPTAATATAPPVQTPGPFSVPMRHSSAASASSSTRR